MGRAGENGSIAEQIRKCIKRSPKTRAEIEEETGLKSNDIRRVLSVAVTFGAVRAVRSPSIKVLRYGLTDLF